MRAVATAVLTVAAVLITALLVSLIMVRRP
jgi:hypothetical protein